MVRVNNFNLEPQSEKALTSTVALGYLPKPVIIYSGMELCDWKERFLQLAKTIPDEKNIYTRCFKALMWAEFCNATLIYAGNSKDESEGLMVKFTFQFSNLECMELFKDHYLENLEIVAGYSATISHC